MLISQKSLHRFCSPQRSLARLLQAGGRTAAGTAPGSTFMLDSRSVSPVPKAIRSKAAAPSPAGRTRPGASSAPCVKVGEKCSTVACQAQAESKYYRGDHY